MIKRTLISSFFVVNKCIIYPQVSQIVDGCGVNMILST